MKKKLDEFGTFLAKVISVVIFAAYEFHDVPLTLCWLREWQCSADSTNDGSSQNEWCMAQDYPWDSLDIALEWFS